MYNIFYMFFTLILQKDYICGISALVPEIIKLEGEQIYLSNIYMNDFANNNCVFNERCILKHILYQKSKQKCNITLNHFY